jgi:hypothetical protein
MGGRVALRFVSQIVASRIASLIVKSGGMVRWAMVRNWTTPSPNCTIWNIAVRLPVRQSRQTA